MRSAEQKNRHKRTIAAIRGTSAFCEVRADARRANGGYRSRYRTNNKKPRHFGRGSFDQKLIDQAAIAAAFAFASPLPSKLATSCVASRQRLESAVI
jgi:hypothetical protein